MAKMDKNRCWQAVSEIATLLTQEYSDLSTAEHMFVLQMSMALAQQAVMDYEEAQYLEQYRKGN